MPKPLTDGIRAIAYLLANATVQHIVEEVTTTIKAHLQEQIMQDAVEHIMGAVKKITGKMSEFKDEFQETSEKLAQTS